MVHRVYGTHRLQELEGEGDGTGLRDDLVRPKVLLGEFL